MQRYLFHEQKGDKLRLFMTKYSTSLRRIIKKRQTDIAAKRIGPFKVRPALLSHAKGLLFTLASGNSPLVQFHCLRIGIFT